MKTQDSPTTRNDVINILTYNVSLNRYDRKFITNILNKYISQNKPLTERQSEVFDVIVEKYKKQLKTIGINYKDLLLLSWPLPFKTLDEIRNESYFKLLDGQMLLHFRFNKDVIAELRALVYDDAHEFLNKNTKQHLGRNLKFDFVWNKEDEEWKGPFNVYLFKAVFQFAIKHTINIDNSVMKLYNYYSNKYGKKEEWTPQLHIVNKHIYINCIVDNMITDFHPTDLSTKNITRICIVNAVAPPTGYELVQENIDKDLMDWQLQR